MLRQRFWVLAIGFLCAEAALRAQDSPDIVELGGHKVHATRLFAKLKPIGSAPLVAARPAALATIAAANLVVRRDYSLVPGLMVLDEPKTAVGPAAIVSPDQRARRLADRLAFLKSSGLFEYVETDRMISINATPEDLRFKDGILWGLQNNGQDGGVAGADIDVIRAWDITIGTNSVVVGVIDTGIRYTHRDLAANMWVNPGEIPGNGLDDDNNGYVDDVHGINATNGSGDPYDDNAHGTHVSGTIGAVANNGEPHVGVAWKVSLMGLKFLRAEGFGFLSDAIECLQYAVNQKAPISNNSWGGGEADQAMADALLAAAAKGHLFITAAGNAASNNDIEFSTPASYPFDNLISVAAINRKDQLADFSNFGNRTVHLGAPGVDIYSTWNSSDTAYDVISGTSMACPHVAGVAALTLAANPKATLFELRQRILNSAVPTPGLAGLTITGGRVSAFRAVSGVVDGTLEMTISPAVGAPLLLGNTTPIFVRVTDVVAVTNAIVTAIINGPGAIDVVLAFTNNGVAPDLTALDAVYSANFNGTAAGLFTFEFIAEATGKVSVTNSFGYSVQPRPDNDQFAKPRKLAARGEQLRNEDTRLSSFETGEVLAVAGANGIGSLWYAWTPAQSGPVLIDTFGTGVAVAVGVYTGSNLNTLSEVASGVPPVLKTSTTFSFQATAGTTYRLAVVGRGDIGRGVFRLRLTPGALVDTVPPQVAFTSPANGFITTTNQFTVTGTAIDPNPGASEVRQVVVNGQNVNVTNGVWTAKVALKTGINTVTAIAQDFAENVSPSASLTINLRAASVENDAFIGASVLAERSGTIKASNVNSSREFGEPPHGGSSGGHSVWWRFTATEDGVLSVNTAGSNFDTLLGIYLGVQVNELTTLAANDDVRAGSNQSAVTVALRAGQTAHVAVDGFSGATGSISLGYVFSAGPVRSLAVNAETGGSVAATLNNLPIALDGVFADEAVVILTATPDNRYEFTGWAGSFSSTANPLRLVLTSNVTLTATFRAVPFSDGFETGDLTRLAWLNDAVAPWGVQSNTVSAGVFAAKAGLVADSQSSSLVVTADSYAGQGAFDFKVSSEAGWDHLEFYLNGGLIQKWSGELGWTTFNFGVPSGANRFEWRYSKDAVRSAGEDTAWLDNVQLRIRPVINPNIPVVVKFLGFVGGQPQLQVSGQVGQVYLVQASNDFTQWTTISTNVNSGGSFTVSDPATFGRVERFYRAVVAP